MSSVITTGHGITIRTPKPADIRGIVEVVRACEPFLTAHMSYIYWMNIRHAGNTCAVAERSGEIVGWCSIIPVSEGRYFLHQFGIAPKARRQGLAEALLVYQLEKLSLKPAAFELEFTIDQGNTAALNLVHAAAGRIGMKLAKRPDPVELVEEACREELYVVASGGPLQAHVCQAAAPFGRAG